MNITQAIGQCPNKIFHIGSGDERRLNYPGIFEYVARTMLEASGAKYDPETLRAISDIMNPSTLQRLIAAEGARRRLDGDPRPVYKPIAPEKPKNAAPAPKKDAKRKAKAAKVSAVKDEAWPWRARRRPPRSSPRISSERPRHEPGGGEAPGVLRRGGVGDARPPADLLRDRQVAGVLVRQVL